MALKRTPQVNKDTAADTEKDTQVDNGTEKDTQVDKDTAADTEKDRFTMALKKEKKKKRLTMAPKKTQVDNSTGKKNSFLSALSVCALC